MTKNKAQAMIEGEYVLTDNSNESRELYDKSRYGSKLDDGRIKLAMIEAVYLSEKKSIELVDKKGKKLSHDDLLKKVKKKKFDTKYAVFKNLRDRGYITKTALKFGADFRVYGKGIKPGQDHAKWIVYAVHESEVQTWQEYAAKNRVAHSTKKKLLLGVVDDEGDISYWESSWFRP